MDISSLLERPKSASSPGNVSTSSRTTTSSKARDDTAGSAQTSTITTATTPAPLTAPPIDASHHVQPAYPPMQTVHYAQHHYAPPPPHFHPMTGYTHYPPTSMPDPRLPQAIPVSHVGASNKRLAPPHPHPGETPAKKKQSKWTADEDRSIIELRGNGMKWEDISKHLPGRSAISCRLRFQNYLERRSEWDEEKKNKLARLYER